MERKTKLDKVEEDCNTCDALGLFNAVSKVIKNETKETKDNEYWEMRSPPDSIELGNSTWTLLHTIAAYYPNQPTEERKSEAEIFLRSFSKIYPCNYCAKDIQEYMKIQPPKLQTQEEFSRWMCDAHNHVNKKLGKPEFDCTLANKRWKVNNK
jgi:FAD-linked sulfhydryl oxidase